MNIEDFKEIRHAVNFALPAEYEVAGHARRGERGDYPDEDSDSQEGDDETDNLVANTITMHQVILGTGFDGSEISRDAFTQFIYLNTGLNYRTGVPQKSKVISVHDPTFAFPPKSAFMDSKFTDFPSGDPDGKKLFKRNVACVFYRYLYHNISEDLHKLSLCDTLGESVKILEELDSSGKFFESIGFDKSGGFENYVAKACISEKLLDGASSGTIMCPVYVKYLSGFLNFETLRCIDPRVEQIARETARRGLRTAQEIAEKRKRKISVLADSNSRIPDYYRTPVPNFKFEARYPIEPDDHERFWSAVEKIKTIFNHRVTKLMYSRLPNPPPMASDDEIGTLFGDLAKDFLFQTT